MALVIQNKLRLKEYETMSSTENTYCLMQKTLPAPLRRAFMETYVFPTHSRYGSGTRQVFSSITFSDIYLDQLARSELGKLDAVNKFIDKLCADKSLPGFNFEVDGPDGYPKLRILGPDGKEVATARIDDIDGLMISVRHIGSDATHNGAMLLEGKVQLSIALFQNAMSFLSDQLPEIGKFVRSNPIFEVNMETLKEISAPSADPLLIAQLEAAMPWEVKMLDALMIEMRGSQKLGHKQIAGGAIIGLLFLRDGRIEQALDTLETKSLQAIPSDKEKQDLFHKTMSESIIELTSLLRDAKSHKLGLIEDARKKATQIIKELYG